MAHRLNHALRHLRSARPIEKHRRALADSARQCRKLAATAIDDMGSEFHLPDSGRERPLWRSAIAEDYPPAALGTPRRACPTARAAVGRETFSPCLQIAAASPAERCERR